MEQQPNKQYFGQEVRDAIIKTSEILTKAVGSTMGPEGNNVGTQSTISLPEVTKDGVTVAKYLEFEDPLQNFICTLLKTASRNTDKVVGDATTTSTVITNAIIQLALKYVNSGFSSAQIVRGIDKATRDTIEQLNKLVLQGDDILEKIATISANNDNELGKLISSAFNELGDNVTIETLPALNKKTTMEIEKGSRYKAGMENEVFQTQPGKFKAERAKLLIYQGNLKDTQSILPYLQDSKEKGFPLVIMADEYSQGAKEHLILIRTQTQAPICLIQTPGNGQNKDNMTRDIEFLTGSPILSEQFGNYPEDFTFDQLGEIESVSITFEHFTFKSTLELDVEDRITEIKKKRDTYQLPTERLEYDQRIAQLSSAIATLHVGGASAVEVAQRIYRVEDAINACKSALEEGFIEGGGIALLKVELNSKMEMEAEQLGYDLMKEAIKAPFTWIVENADINSDVVELKIKDTDQGYNAKTGQYGNMLEMGIVDPKKSIRVALENASSVAQMLITMDSVVL